MPTVHRAHHRGWWHAIAPRRSTNAAGAGGGAPVRRRHGPRPLPSFEELAPPAYADVPGDRGGGSKRNPTSASGVASGRKPSLRARSEVHAARRLRPAGRGLSRWLTTLVRAAKDRRRGGDTRRLGSPLGEARRA